MAEPTQPDNQPTTQATPPVTQPAAPPTDNEKALTEAKAAIAALNEQLAAFQAKEQEAEKIRLAAEQKALEEQGNFKTLAEQAQARAKELEEKLAQREHEALVAKIAAEHKLPPELAERLRGTTEAELKADAAKLAKIIPATTQPANANRTGPRPAQPVTNGNVTPLVPGSRF